MIGEDLVEALIRDYKPLVYSIARNMCPWDPYDDDLLQNGLIGLWKAAEKWDQVRPFGPLAKKCVRDEMASYMRRLNRQPEQVSFDPELHAPTRPDDYSAMELRDAVLRRYPPESRKARSVAALLEWRNARDAGHALGIRPVRVRAHARTALRSALGDDFYPGL